MNTFLIGFVVKSSLLIGGAAALNLLLRARTSAATRHLVWTLALSSVLLLPILSALVPTWGIPIHVKAEAPVATAQVAVPDEISVGATVTTAATAAVERAAVPAVEPTGKIAPSASLFTRINAFAALYLAGALLLGLRLAFGRHALARIVRQSTEVTDPEWRELLHECESRMGVSQPVRLLRSLDRNMPMAFGLRTPTILIPAIADTWSLDRRRAVLLHELAHIVRHDCFTQLMAELTCAAYWMHPGVWFVSRRLRVERELACDDRVLSVGTAARDYASHLLELAYSLGGYRSPALVVSMARPRQLEGRMLAVLDAARNRVTPPRRALLMGLVAAVALVLPLAAAEAVVVSEPTVTPAMVVWSDPAPAVELPPAPAVELSPLAPIAAQKLPPPPPPPPPVPSDDRRREIQLPGTWEMRTSDDAGKVYLQVSERPHSQHGFMITLDQLAGFTTSMLTGEGGPAKFNITRDAGTISFDGVFRSGVGAGTFDFTPSPTFGAAMAKRGFETPTKTEQYLLARGNIGFAYLDELNAQKYEKPTLEDLVRAADHGVHLDYLKGMGSAGYHLGQVSALVRTRDHGVTPDYVRALAEEGFKNLSVEDLVRARDHGVTAQYAGAMRAFGYGGLPLEELIKARDHGVTTDYIREMAAAGHAQLPLRDLVRARDHGVNPEFVKAMRDAGYGALSVDELINARDHGVNGEFVRAMTALGPERPSLEELVNARDHGVSPDFVKSWRELGYPLALAEMVRARDHGVGTEFIKDLREVGYEKLSIDELIRLRDHGVSVSYVRKQNASSTSRLTVDELVRRRDRGM